jgi:high affinity Mn2+ porin
MSARLFVAMLAWGALASPSAAAEDSGAVTERFNVVGQFTAVAQYHPGFTSPYRGANSLDPYASGKETTDLTLYAGLRLSSNAALYVDPEIDQGFGLSNTLGAAGFPSGEAYKVGSNSPYVRLPRLFVRQTVNLDGPVVPLESGANQLAGALAADNLVLTIGKFSMVDVFDTNSYAHDPRGDFLNWAIVDAGAFDYAADAWGYTYGAAAEWTRGRWTLRGGLFDLSDVPNSKNIDRGLHQYSVVAEAELRHTLGDHPGKVKLLLFGNRARLGRYDDAVAFAALHGGAPDMAAVRRIAWKPGVVLNLEQELSPGIGLFARASANDGRYESEEFTEINRSLAAGLSVKGEGWGRPKDTVGLAGVVNGLAGAARSYFAAGGTGILIGDGRLPNYGRERILEAFYSAQITERATVALDYQYLVAPAYNRDRGPVSVYGARLHLEF